MKNRFKKGLVTLVLSGLVTFSAGTAWAEAVQLSLEESINMALNNNKTIKVALADKEAATWKVNEAKGNSNINIAARHSTARYRAYNSTKTAYGIADLYSNSITASLPIYTGGKIEGAIKQAEVGAEIADLGLVNTVQQVKMDATVGYYNILQANNLVQVSQQSVDSLNEHLKNVKAQYSVGTVAKSDVLRSEVELANAQQNLIKAQNNLELAVSSFNNIVGLPLETEVTVKDELKYQQYDKSLEESIAYAKEHRPDGLQATKSIDAAKAGVKVAESGKLPQLSFQGTSGWSNDEFPGTHYPTWQVAVVADMNLFDGNVTKAKVRQAEASLTKSVEQASQKQDVIQLEVRQAYLNMLEAEKRITTSKVTVDKGQEDFKIAQVRYSAGVGTNLDVIDSQLALTQAKTNYIQAMYDYNTSRAKLDKAMGIAVL